MVRYLPPHLQWKRSTLFSAIQISRDVQSNYWPKWVNSCMVHLSWLALVDEMGSRIDDLEKSIGSSISALLFNVLTFGIRWTHDPGWYRGARYCATSMMITWHALRLHFVRHRTCVATALAYTNRVSLFIPFSWWPWISYNAIPWKSHSLHCLILGV